MKISLIVAMAQNRAIGLNNQMPWHLSQDLKRFKQLTMGHPIIMGRKTFEAIGKPLPGRTNIIVSRNPDYNQADCEVKSCLEDAIQTACKQSDEIFIIGGATLYQAALPLADILYITQINKDFDGDTFFPEFDWTAWQVVDRIDVNNDEKVDFTYSFLQFSKKSNK